MRKLHEVSSPRRIFELGFAGWTGVRQAEIVKSSQTGILCLAYLCPAHSFSCVKYVISLAKSEEECRGYKTGDTETWGYSRLRAGGGSFLGTSGSVFSVSSFMGLVKSSTEGGRSWKGKLQEKSHLLLEAARVPAAAASKPLRRLLHTPTPNPRVSGEGQQPGPGMLEPDALRRAAAAAVASGIWLLAGS